MTHPSHNREMRHLQGGVVLLKGDSTRKREALHDEGTPKGPLVENAMAAN